jgi:hypothetical protein
VGKAALERAGRRRWSKRVHTIVAILEAVIAYDRLYIDGGNAELIEPPLAAKVKIVANIGPGRVGLDRWDRSRPFPRQGADHKDHQCADQQAASLRAGHELEQRNYLGAEVWFGDLA